MENIIFYKTSEEYKAIKRLEEMTIDFRLKSEDMHYAIVLYDLIINLQKENEELKERIKNYEDPEDLTLMFMYCDIKAKDKIKELKERINKIMEIIELNQYNYGYQIKEEILKGNII